MPSLLYATLLRSTGGDGLEYRLQVVARGRGTNHLARPVRLRWAIVEPHRFDAEGCMWEDRPGDAAGGGLVAGGGDHDGGAVALGGQECERVEAVGAEARVVLGVWRSARRTASAAGVPLQLRIAM